VYFEPILQPLDSGAIFTACNAEYIGNSDIRPFVNLRGMAAVPSLPTSGPCSLYSCG
jgi:hypothetical protein